TGMVTGSPTRCASLTACPMTRVTSAAVSVWGWAGVVSATAPAKPAPVSLRSRARTRACLANVDRTRKIWYARATFTTNLETQVRSSSTHLQWHSSCSRSWSPLPRARNRRTPATRRRAAGRCLRPRRSPRPPRGGNPRAPPGYTGRQPPPGPSPAEEEVDIRDRWRVGLPFYNRQPDNLHEAPLVRGEWWDPYDQNIVKGDYPVFGT